MDIKGIALDLIGSNQNDCNIEDATYDRKQYTIGYNDGVIHMARRVINMELEPSVLDYAKAIKKFCSEADRCIDCPLHAKDDPLGCALAKKDDYPEYWEFDESEDSADVRESDKSIFD